MALANYSDLQAAVASWLNRSDLTAQIPDFINLAEVWMMRELRLRLLETEASLTPTTGARTTALPADYREPLNLWFVNGVDREPLRFIPAALLDVYTIAGRPYQWTIDGANVAFERPTDGAYTFTFRYRQKVALSAGSPTNALLTQYPDVYLFATLVEAAPYLKDKDALAMWEMRRGQAAHKIREEEERQNSQVALSSEAALIRPQRTGYNIYRGT